MASMESMSAHLRSLPPAELRRLCASVGLACGPITASTRSVFERRLAAVLTATTITAGGVKKEGAEPGDEKGAESATEAESGDSKGAETASGAEPVNTKWEESAVGAEPGVMTVAESAGGADPGDPKGEESAVGAESGEGVGGAKAVGGVEPQTTFYGVCADWSCKKDGQTGGVFADRALALQALRSLPGSRFKAFATRGEAEGFSLGDSGGPHGALTSDPPSRVGAVVGETPPSSFRSPRPQELVTVLRRAVETGDVDSFTRTVWDNPRYLVGSGDNPTILQEGCRYNALHVGARCGQTAVCLALLRTLAEERFLRLLYPGDPESTLSRRQSFLVDLYLNTPDRGACDSPLHFACKFGHAGVVRVLASHPATDISRPNRDGLTPSQVICDRSAVKTAELKAKILSYLENRCFVPLLRSQLEPLSPPVVAQPCPPSPSFNPLSPPPPSPSAPRGGGGGGGGGLAWSEYWDFLGTFLDLGSAEGLATLEAYLRGNRRGNGKPAVGNRDVPSKLDQDVLIAVGDAPLDRSRLPLVSAWQRRVLNHSLDQRQQ
uniref:Ankyrin repeat and LEM domain-containing protein 2 n=1 Tax=Petromyzon marinus TaxID=7757 RepID=A0AAJ7XJI8_PETMA|nr:ankyrin repeat and LEM domain-containing protein 2 [Petromyzon marinus]